MNKLKAAAKIHLRHIRNYTTAQNRLRWQATEYDADEDDTTDAAAEIDNKDDYNDDGGASKGAGGSRKMKRILRMLMVMTMKMMMPLMPEVCGKKIDQGKRQLRRF